MNEKLEFVFNLVWAVIMAIGASALTAVLVALAYRLVVCGCNVRL